MLDTAPIRISRPRHPRGEYINPWTGELTEQLKQLWSAGKTGSEIAAELGGVFTRSGVMGKVRRLGLEFRNNGALDKTRAKPRRPKAERRFEAPSYARKPEPIKIVDDAIPFAQRCTLLQLTNETCRWPVGDPRSPDFFYCGSPTADLAECRPYCAAHAARAQSRHERIGPFRLKFLDSKAA